MELKFPYLVKTHQLKNTAWYWNYNSPISQTYYLDPHIFQFYCSECLCTSLSCDCILIRLGIQCYEKGPQSPHKVRNADFLGNIVRIWSAFKQKSLHFWISLTFSAQIYYIFLASLYVLCYFACLSSYDHCCCLTAQHSSSWLQEVVFEYLFGKKPHGEKVHIFLDLV